MLKNDQEVVVDQRVHEVRKLETENQKEETEIGKVIVIENVTAGIWFMQFWFCEFTIVFYKILLIYRQKRSRSRDKDYERSRKPGSTSFDRRASKSPEKKPATIPDIVKPIKTKEELREEAAAAAIIAKVNSIIAKFQSLL